LNHNNDTSPEEVEALGDVTGATWLRRMLAKANAASEAPVSKLKRGDQL
jgi:hypothetical protein